MHRLLDSVDDATVLLFYVRFPTLDAFFKMESWDRGQSCFTWQDLEQKFDGNFDRFINVFEIWAT